MTLFVFVFVKGEHVRTWRCKRTADSWIGFIKRAHTARHPRPTQCSIKTEQQIINEKLNLCCLCVIHIRSTLLETRSSSNPIVHFSQIGLTLGESFLIINVHALQGKGKTWVLIKLFTYILYLTKFAGAIIRTFVHIYTYYPNYTE